MRIRRDVVAFIESQLLWEHDTTHTKKDASHYGRQELRDLLDFIYEGEPMFSDEYIQSPHGDTWKSDTK